MKKRRGRKEVERKCEEGEREKSERKLREQTKSERAKRNERVGGKIKHSTSSTAYSLY